MRTGSVALGWMGALALLGSVLGCGPPLEGPTLTVHVVRGPPPLTDAAGAFVRLESASGEAFEQTTDAAGNAALPIVEGGGPWSVTVAARGYAAVSIVGLTSSPVGAIRLDPLVTGTHVEGTLSGTVTGAVPGTVTRIDTFAFGTTRAAADGSYRGSYYGFPDRAIPFRLFAVGIDAGGRAVNIGVTEGSALRDGSGQVVDVVMPATPPPRRSTSLRVDLPATGLINAATTSVLDVVGPVQSFDADPGSYALVGAGTATASGGGFDVIFDDFPSVPSSHALASFGTASGRLNVVMPVTDGAHTVVIPEVRVAPAVVGTNLANVTVESDSDFDCVALHIGEDGFVASSWRVFFLDTSATATRRVPALPTAIAAGDLRLDGATTSVLAMLITMREGAVWSTAAAASPVPEYAATFAASLASVGTSLP